MSADQFTSLTEQVMLTQYLLHVLTDLCGHLMPDHSPLPVEGGNPVVRTAPRITDGQTVLSYNLMSEAPLVSDQGQVSV